MSINPYQVLGTNPVVMRGRERLFDQLCRHLTKPTPDHVSVVGPKFIGKSVLLKHLAGHFSADNAHYIAVLYWDLRHGTPESDADFKRRFGEEIKGSLHLIRPDLASELDIDSDDIGDMLDAVFSILEDDGQRVLAVLDGFDRILAGATISRNLWDYMRDLAHKSSLRLVTGSQRRLQDLCKTEESRTSDFWEIFYDSPLDVGPFVEADLEGIFEPFFQLNISFDPSAQKEIMNWTGGVPVLMAALMSRLYDEFKDESILSKPDIDQFGPLVVEQCRDLLGELWADCTVDMQSDLTALAEKNLPLAEIPDLRCRALKKRGYVQIAGSRLKSNCRIMEHYAKQKSGGMANLRRLFGDEQRYYENIRSLLEMRLSQVRRTDPTLHGYVERAICDLYPHAGDSVVWMRSIAERAFDLIWDVELPPDRSLPMKWTEEWKHAGKKWSEDSQGRLPGSQGAQCNILRLITGSKNANPVARHIKKPTFLVLDYLQSVGDFGQHKEDQVTLGFAASVCLSAIALCESLAEDLSEAQREQSGILLQDDC